MRYYLEVLASPRLCRAAGDDHRSLTWVDPGYACVDRGQSAVWPTKHQLPRSAGYEKYSTTSFTKGEYLKQLHRPKLPDIQDGLCPTGLTSETLVLLIYRLNESLT